MLADFTEPHKKFLARLRRDVIANEIVTACEWRAVRLKSEDVCQRPAFAKAAEALHRVSRVDLPAAVAVEDDAMNRVHAVMVALAWTGHRGLTLSQVEEATDGTLDYLKELEKRRRECPGLTFLITVDRMIRRNVHQ